MKTKQLLTGLALGLGLILTLGVLLSTGRAASLTQPLPVPDAPSTVLFRDDFNGAIDDSWTIQNDDSSYYTITADHLELRANAGDIWEGLNNHENLFLIDPPTTTADFDMTIRVIEFSPVHQHAAQIDLIVYDDDDNLVRHIYGYPYGAHNLEFGAEVGGAYSNSGGTDPEAVTPMDFGDNPFYLRLRKAGNIYRQYYSTDGIVFTATRKIVIYGDGTPAKVGFVALADPSESSVAKIDWFEITQLLVPGNPVIHPISNTHTAPTTASVSIAYDDAIDPATVSTQTFAVHAMQTGLLLEAYDVDNGTITLSPTHPFKPGELVQVSATADTLNMSGQGPILPTVWQFRAAAAGGSGFFIDSGQNLGSSDSYRVTLGDLDGDGDLDGFVPNGIWPSTGLPNTVWLNDGGVQGGTLGSFTDSGQTLGNSASLGAALGDLDGDGDLDAFVANGGYQPNQVWWNDGTGTFVSGQSLGGAYSWSVALGDLDGDGDLDAFVANGVNQANRVWVNDGTGIFYGGQSLGSSDSGDVALGDLDGDGDLDAFVVNFVGQPARVWINDRTGIFGDSGQGLGGSHSHRVALGDADGDGDLDALVVNESGQANTLWLNDGMGIFIDSGQNLGSVGRDIALGDLDGDGDLDAFVAIVDDGGNRANKVWQNDGTGTFTETQGMGDSPSLSVALGDVDGDGDLDAFVGNASGPNKVWLNELFDLSIDSLTVDPDPAYAGEEVLLTAQVRNTGLGVAENVPVRYAVDDVPFDTRIVAAISPGTSVPVTTTWSFTSTGIVNLSATVNPDGSLPELVTGDNTAFTTLDLVWEKSPGWSRPDLALSSLSFSPHRPDAGDDVVVAAQLRNLSYYRVPSATVELRIDNLVVEEQVIDDIEPASSRIVSLTWNGATPGRHVLQLLVDPDEQIKERSEDNNHVSERLRVAGESNPLPDIEVEAIGLDPPAPNIGDSGTISVEIHNEGYAPITGLPIVLTLDGREISRTVIPALASGESVTLIDRWADIREGHHIIVVQVDPDDTIQDASLQTNWARGIVVPGAQYQWISASQLSGRWQFIGPDTINNRAYVGRIDSIAVSQQTSQTIVVGAVAGGVWRTMDGGQSWSAQGDHLPSPRFSTVAVDPTDHDIIYAASGSIHGGGTGLYKSIDGGAHWSVFARHHGTWLSDGYSGLVLTYTHPNSLTIFAGSNRGVWVWQGDKLATQTDPNDWEQVCQPGEACHNGAVNDILMTSENPPQLYWSVGASVYRVDATDPLSGTVAPLGAGLPGDGYITLGNSPANLQRVYAAIKRSNGSFDIYRRDHTGNWDHRGSPTGNCTADNNFMGVHPNNADILYIGSIIGCRCVDGNDSATCSYRIPNGQDPYKPDNFVHDDYKAIAFDPNDPSVVFFVTDGGVYRCTSATGDMQCWGLNDKLGTTQFYDIATAATKPSRIIGGTQDNGNIKSDGSTSWTNMSYGGDGKYVAIDPVDENTMFAQYQYVNSIFSTTVAGPPWAPANAGLPASQRDPFMVMHPTDGRTLLVADEQVYRTTNAGGWWSPIGPATHLTSGGIKRIAIDGVNDRYYAGTTTGGHIWAVDAAQAGALTWTRIYTNPDFEGVSSLLVDLVDPNTIWATFWGTSAARVVKLKFNGSTWPGNESDWTGTPIAGNLPPERRLAGGQKSAIRGLLKDPSAEVLYVGTDRGVYQGRLISNTWQWFPDTCGLPLTFVSDLELHASGAFMTAATFGRGAYTRTVAQLNPAPDAHDTPTRNDDITTAATLGTVTETITQLGLEPNLRPGLAVHGLNMDRPNDTDFFTVQLPPEEANACLPPGDPILADPRASQCTFSFRIHAPDTPDPFQLRLYKADGSVVQTNTVWSELTYDLSRPYDIFPGGLITLSVHSPTGCRSQYDLRFWYHDWVSRIDAPIILLDPPAFNWILPELGDFDWMYPADPTVINQAFVGQAPEQLPPQRTIFHWDRDGDFLAALTIEGAGDLGVTLLDATGSPVASTISLNQLRAGTAVVTSTKQISVTDLPAGWYALEFSDGDFPTYFDVAVDVPRYQIALPLVLRNHP